MSVRALATQSNPVPVATSDSVSPISSIKVLTGCLNTLDEPPGFLTRRALGTSNPPTGEFPHSRARFSTTHVLITVSARALDRFQVRVRGNGG